ncbi:hypothetical protein [Flavobacterium caeni]|nr:hypothetical protein [Flavobacterium caeni]
MAVKILLPGPERLGPAKDCNVQPDGESTLVVFIDDLHEPARPKKIS